MNELIHVSENSSLYTTASALPEGIRRSLAAVPETRGASVVVLEPVSVPSRLPEGFVDIDALVEAEERDIDGRTALAEARRQIVDQFYQDETKALARYRLQKGWSQKELASRLGTSQSYIARLEAGSIDPQVSTLRRLAEVLEVEPAALFNAISGVRK